MLSGLSQHATAAQMEQQAQRDTEVRQNTPTVTALAAHVRKRWQVMQEHKKKEIEPRLSYCVRARNMQYDPAKLAEIRSQGGSEIFMGVVSAKCRTATAWLRDALLGSGADKPWSLASTPIPEVSPDIVAGLERALQQQLLSYYAQGNDPVDPDRLKQIAGEMKSSAMRQIKHEADIRISRMEKKLEDQLAEGGFVKALFELTNDVATFPYAVLKGPVPRKRKVMQYTNGGLEAVEVMRDEWERVDPYKFYWGPWGDDPQNMPIIELHHLSRVDVESMIGVSGYDEGAVRSVLANFGTKQAMWIGADVGEIEDTTGKDFSGAGGDIVYALQLWDSIPGRMLVDWGIDEAEIPDPHLSYPCEVWLVDDIVIKAVLNYDPIGRKPYYATSFEKIPGRLDGHGVADLCMDAQNMCNAAARALANNMGISSGPQVGVNISRLPAGEDITDLHPWKIWQFQQSDFGDSAPPISFFQPQSNAGELMAVFDRFMAIADEVSGIPRYMTGGHVPGAGRTSSGLSMLISNAGKSIKQVIANIDHDILQPMLERQYQRNLRYSDDPDLVGDVQVVARGAMALVVKEAEAVRKDDFLRLVLESPVAQQIVGLPGTAELLRDLAGNLNINIDRLVPSREDVERQQQAAQQQMQQQTAPDLSRQEDGSAQGGRESNFISARPSGV